ncbi:tyrosine-type recombinase/integrase [Virgibacillus halodenitrificans]|uniref:tyrosine-type recombinase/integrase n=1 Tax=Virgibacillus halodenitrificans TaxID=1482 RepID=UPI000EF52CFF|nr:tyrosine-type recombinase/integrase [Virgibacillus halodenitrificans]
MQNKIIKSNVHPVETYIPADVLSLLLNDKRSDHTKKAYNYDINRFFTYMTGEGVTSESVQRFLSLPKYKALEKVIQYRNYLISEEKQSESTINRRISAIRSLVKLAKTLGYCDYDLQEVKFERVQTYRDTTGISLDQFKEMLKVPNRETLKGKRDFAILFLLFETAMRRGELTKICLEDYDSENKNLWIIGKGKGTQKESITISSQVVAVINDYLTERRKFKTLNATDPLFATTDRRTRGSAISGEAVRRIVRNCAFNARIAKPMSPHKIRHSSITIALDKTNGDVRSVRKLSRHKKIDTLLIYDDNRKNQQGEITNMLSSLL